MPYLLKEDIQEIKKIVNKNVGENIRKVREKKNITQTELGDMIHSDRQYVYKIESGKVGLSVVKLIIIAKALEVNAGELM